MKVTVNELRSVIIRQAIEIDRLTQRNQELEETAQAEKDWVRQAKQDADYPDNISFDVVWADALRALKQSRK